MPVQGTVYIHSQRRYRFVRSDTPPPLRLTGRDRDIIFIVAEYRLLSRNHIQALFFPHASVQTCDRVLARLFHHAYLQRLRPSTEWGSGDRPTIYALDRKGHNLLLGDGNADVRCRRGGLKPIGHYFIDHMLALNDVRVAFTLAVTTHGLTLDRWIPEAKFRSSPDSVVFTQRNGKQLTRTIIPDAACILHEPGYTSRFLIEIDRATEDNPRFVREKVRPGLVYLKSEAYRKRFGFNSGRWLVVTTSEKRLSNMKQATEATVGKAASVFYFTTLAAVRSETILTAPIWQRGGERHPRALLYR